MVAKLNLDIDYIRKRYWDDNVSCEIIAKELNCHTATIWKRIKDNNIGGRSWSDAALLRSREYQCNKDYFRTWSSDMAYILGFITADGCISKGYGTYSLRFSLAQKDECVIQYIKEKLTSTHPIKYTIKTRKTGYISRMCHFRLSSTQLVNGLFDLNITERKTGNEIVPDIPKEYKFDYLRGLFDGDGSIGFYPRKRGKRNPNKLVYNSRFCICSQSEQFLNNIKELIFNFGKVSRLNKRDTCYLWRISNPKTIFELYKKIYNGNFCLLRKKEIFERMIEYYEYK